MNSDERSQVDKARTRDLQEQARKDDQDQRILALQGYWRPRPWMERAPALDEEIGCSISAAAGGAGENQYVEEQTRRLLYVKLEAQILRDMFLQALSDWQARLDISNGISSIDQVTRSCLRAIRERIGKNSLSDELGLGSCIERIKMRVCMCDHDHCLVGQRTLQPGYVVTEERLLFGHHAHPLEEASLGSTSHNGGGDGAYTLNIKYRGMPLHQMRSFTAQNREAELDAFVAAHLTTNLTETKSQLPMRTPKVETDVCHCSEHSKYSISDGLKEELLQYIIRGGADAYAVDMLVADNNGVDVQNFVSTIFGGFVVLSFTNLIGTSKGDYPEFIRLGLYVGYVLLIVLTFLGLTTKKMAKLAIRVAAGMSIAAVTISAVYQVSENVYIRSFIGILGVIGTLVMAVIKWR